MKFEICVDSILSAVVAEEANADRIELCANLLEGGTTPSFGVIKQTRANVGLGLQVLIRPRGGDFLYSDIEKEVIIDDIRMAKELGANGVVVGVLDANGNLDLEFLELMMEIAWPMNVTFHRAFDLCRDADLALKQLRVMGVDHILTSGQQATAFEGVDCIRKLVRDAKDQVVIMPGGGIDEGCIEKLVKKTHVKEIHFSGREWVRSQMKYCREGVPMGNAACSDEFRWKEASLKRIRGMMALVE